LCELQVKVKVKLNDFKPRKVKVKVQITMKIIASQISLPPGVLAHVTFDVLTQTLTHPSFPQVHQ